jgi:hypothetical protein
VLCVLGMRPHFVSKVLSLYDRVAHHRRKPSAPDTGNVADIADATETETEDDGSDEANVAIELDDDNTRVTARMAAVADSGDLYGVHTPAAADRHIPDNDASFETGQNWIEALEERAAEGGPEPEHEVDVEDDNDNKHPHSDHKDRPIADLGSGGRGGM